MADPSANSAAVPPADGSTASKGQVPRPRIMSRASFSRPSQNQQQAATLPARSAATTTAMTAPAGTNNATAGTTPASEQHPGLARTSSLVRTPATRPPPKTASSAGLSAPNSAASPTHGPTRTATFVADVDRVDSPPPETMETSNHNAVAGQRQPPPAVATASPAPAPAQRTAAAAATDSPDTFHSPPPSPSPPRPHDRPDSPATPLQQQQQLHHAAAAPGTLSALSHTSLRPPPSPNRAPTNRPPPSPMASEGASATAASPPSSRAAAHPAPPSANNRPPAFLPPPHVPSQPTASATGSASNASHSEARPSPPRPPPAVKTSAEPSAAATTTEAPPSKSPPPSPASHSPAASEANSVPHSSQPQPVPHQSEPTGAEGHAADPRPQSPPPTTRPAAAATVSSPPPANRPTAPQPTAAPATALPPAAHEASAVAEEPQHQPTAPPPAARPPPPPPLSSNRSDATSNRGGEESTRGASSASPVPPPPAATRGNATDATPHVLNRPPPPPLERATMTTTTAIRSADTQTSPAATTVEGDAFGRRQPPSPTLRSNSTQTEVSESPTVQAARRNQVPPPVAPSDDAVSTVHATPPRSQRGQSEVSTGGGSHVIVSPLPPPRPTTGYAGVNSTAAPLQDPRPRASQSPPRPSLPRVNQHDLNGSSIVVTAPSPTALRHGGDAASPIRYLDPQLIDVSDDAQGSTPRRQQVPTSHFWSPKGMPPAPNLHALASPIAGSPMRMATTVWIRIDATELVASAASGSDVLAVVVRDGAGRSALPTRLHSSEESVDLGDILAVVPLAQLRLDYSSGLPVIVRAAWHVDEWTARQTTSSITLDTMSTVEIAVEVRYGAFPRGPSVLVAKGTIPAHVVTGRDSEGSRRVPVVAVDAYVQRGAASLVSLSPCCVIEWQRSHNQLPPPAVPYPLLNTSAYAESPFSASPVSARGAGSPTTRMALLGVDLHQSYSYSASARRLAAGTAAPLGSYTTPNESAAAIEARLARVEAEAAALRRMLQSPSGPTVSLGRSVEERRSSPSRW